MDTNQAIIVKDIFKKFGKPGDPLWVRVSKQLRKNNHNGSTTKTGAKPDHSQVRCFYNIDGRLAKLFGYLLNGFQTCLK